MRGPYGIARLLLAGIAAIAPALVVAACAIQLRGEGDSTPSGIAGTQATDPVAAGLDRCRTVTSEQAAELQKCRRVWAENRRRFLGHSKEPVAPSIHSEPNLPPVSSAQPKDPERALGGRPPVATPKSE